MKLLREPLLHFLIAGSLLFGGYEWLNRAAPAPETEGPVRIGDGEVRWLRETFANQWRRGPTGEEMNDLVATLVEEELLAREARGLGLDQNDTIVRRRLAQKLTFLVEDTSRIADPSEDELRRFYVEHAIRYRTEPRVSFTHIFFSPERRPQAEDDARALLAMVSAASGQRDKLPQGDPLLLEDTYADVDQQAVASVFGADFARAIFALTLGRWSGPVKSAPHLCRTMSRPDTQSQDQRTDADVQGGAAHGDSPTDEANASSRRWSKSSGCKPLILRDLAPASASGFSVHTAERTLRPARMFTESLTPRPELENGQDPKPT